MAPAHNACYRQFPSFIPEGFPSFNPLGKHRTQAQNIGLLRSRHNRTIIKGQI